MRRFILALGLAVALVIPATIAADGPTDIPGWNDVDAAAQAYWATKLRGNFSNVGNPDPAMFLAQYLEVARTKSFLPNDYGHISAIRYPISDADLTIGLAYARALAVQGGVTPAQLAAADVLMRVQYGPSLDGVTVNAPPPVSAAVGYRYAGAIARLRTYIARLTACACNPVKLALYQARLDVYLAR